MSQTTVHPVHVPDTLAIEDIPLPDGNGVLRRLRGTKAAIAGQPEVLFQVRRCGGDCSGVFIEPISRPDLQELHCDHGVQFATRCLEYYRGVFSAFKKKNDPRREYPVLSGPGPVAMRVVGRSKRKPSMDQQESGRYED